MSNIDKWLKADKDKRVVLALLRTPDGPRIQASITDPTGPSTEVFGVAWGKCVGEALTELDLLLELRQ